MIKVCTTAKVAKYTGLHKPNCNRKVGCWRCWAKYHSGRAK